MFKKIVFIAFCVYSLSVQAQWTDRNVAVDSEWDLPVRWLEEESQKHFPPMKALVLPSDMPQVSAIIKTDGWPLVASYYDNLQVNGSPQKVCIIGRNRNEKWSGWGSSMGDLPTVGMRLWLLTHEWSHCLEWQEGKKGSTFKDLQKSEQLADVMATMTLVSKSKERAWLNKIYIGRKVESPNDIHYTWPAMKRLVDLPMEDWVYLNFKARWEKAKEIVEEANR